MLPSIPRPLVVAAAVLCFYLCSSLLVAVAEAKERHYDWEISYQHKSPDCFEKLAVTVNGEAPGPTIYATQGDTVVVTVHNKLETENTAIHWHGIRQIDTPWADGVAGVTQCPILPGETFTYKFVVDRAGTYMYHAHYGMQRVAGLNGMIVVAVPEGVRQPFTYDEEHTILLEDWWHKSVYDQATGLFAKPFVFVGKTYLLRIGSLTSLSSLSFEIEGHLMTVVEADGHYVRPFVVRNLFIYSGETYSVLVKADQDPRRNYWATSHIVGRNPKTPSGKAIVSYAGNNPWKTPPTAPTSGPPWNNTAIRVEQSRAIVAHPGYVVPAPARADRTLLLLNTQNNINGHIKWTINGVSLHFPVTPYLVSMKRGLTTAYDQRPPLDTYDHIGHDISAPAPTNGTIGSPVYRLAFDSVVDVVLQNSNALNNMSETHPWHLHGHDFWVLGHGDGKFDPAADTWRLLNVKDPIMKNTVPLHPDGWTAIRFHANNPGVWLFHCHVEAHVFMGMGVVFEEGVERAPGPTICATQGDTVVITVHNKLETENTAIHWHGIRQCPILPGETFTYKFVVDRAGTYLYHAHYGMQRVAGLNGMIVVTGPEGVREPFRYDDQHTILLEDWWHKSVYDQATGLSAKPFVFVGEPQSLLINGRGTFNCSKVANSTGSCNNSHPDCALPTQFTFVPGKTYFLRIGSLMSLSSFNFEIEGHSMTVVEADGPYVRPLVVRNIFIYSGETYSVLVKADQDPRRNYCATSHIVGRNPKTPSGKATVSYAGNDPRKQPPTAPPTGPAWNNTGIRVEQSTAIIAHPGYVVPVPQRADRTFLLLNTQDNINGHIKWTINDMSLHFPATPYLISMKYGLTDAYDQRPPLDTYDHRGHDISSPAMTNGTIGSPVYRLAFDSVVDVVLRTPMRLTT
ncbi:hypothetical protein QYE76_006547 [Lolium multiflorum]|uniref:L-ascorbate oxidase n=1 Tax=Lolium multiflorum TaxID=4521 RepID=A0AAD8RWV5_LOLMU|nr:hypothetical protein QYE76_006547 [Lolium multiflorum]